MRSYIFRLPLFTRCIILVIVLLWLLSLQSAWDVQQWGSLIPDEIGLATSSFFFLYPTPRFLRFSVELG
jgi:glycosylphosphatidylinositol transamidase